MILVSHPTGTRNLRQLVHSLAMAGLLDEFHTTLGWSKPPLNRLLPAALRREMGRRAYDELSAGRLRVHPWREAVRLLAGRAGLHGLTRHESGWASIDQVYHALDRSVARRVCRRPPAVVYAYDDGALASFAAARRVGTHTVLDLPTAYWAAAQAIAAEEAEASPAWAALLPPRRDSAAKLARKDAELALAQEVVVASRFAAHSLGRAGPLGARIHVVPYGAPPPAPPRPPAGRGPLKVLFVGRLDQQKGISYLFEAMRRLGHEAGLTLLGARPGEPCPALDAALAGHRWLPPLPHGEALAEMRRHDVLVFPSLCDGFGLVLLEALAQGLPVIASTNCGGPDIIDDGVDGFVVPIRDPDAIAARLALLAGDRPRLAAMGEAARSKAAALSWARYRAAMAALARLWLDEPPT